MIWKKWRKRKTNWTGANSQNELLETLYHGVIDKVLASIRKGRGGLFSIIVQWNLYKWGFYKWGTSISGATLVHICSIS